MNSENTNYDYFTTYFHRLSVTNVSGLWSVITFYNLTLEKRDNNYLPHPVTPTSCLRTKFNL